jgi:hypothetical protein
LPLGGDAAFARIEGATTAPVARLQKLESTGFKITTSGPIGFEISFSSEHDATEFQLFGWER